MVSEVKRNIWSRFCKKFSATNQLRPTRIKVKTALETNNRGTETDYEYPFMGITVAKEGRYIDRIELYTGQMDPDSLFQPTISIKQPSKIMVSKDKKGFDNQLIVEGKDGTRATIMLEGESHPDIYKSFLEKLAYGIAERHGFEPGRDREYWYEAEQKYQEVSSRLTV